MIKVKCFEVRDRMTFIPVMVVQFSGQDSPLISEAGYSMTLQSTILIKLNDGKAKNDPHEWNDRTMQEAHLFIDVNFDTLKDQDVVDVEFIRGETSAPKTPQREDHYR